MYIKLCICLINVSYRIAPAATKTYAPRLSGFYMAPHLIISG